jgi:hypothetical protein
MVETKGISLDRKFMRSRGIPASHTINQIQKLMKYSISQTLVFGLKLAETSEL